MAAGFAAILFIFFSLVLFLFHFFYVILHQILQNDENRI